MDNKTGGTPNPLNPTPAGVPDSAPSITPRPATTASNPAPISPSHASSAGLKQSIKPTPVSSAMPNIAPRSTRPAVRPAARTATRPVRTGRPVSMSTRTAPEHTQVTPEASPEVKIETIAVETETIPSSIGDNLSNEGASPSVLSETLVESLDPNGRMMEQSPVEAVAPAPAKKKSKKGLIITLVVILLLLIGGGVVAALFILGVFRGNAVNLAMEKIMSGNAPANVAIDGDIDLHINTENSPISRINIDLDSDITFGSMINTSSAVLNITTTDQRDYSIEFEELYSADGDLFFKISDPDRALSESGILGLLLNSSTSIPEIDNCIEGDINCASEPMICDEDGTNCEPASVDCEDTEDGCIATEAEEIEGIVMPGEEFDPQSTNNAEVMSSGLAELLVNEIVSVIETSNGTMIRVSTDGLVETADGPGDQSNVSCITNLVSDLNKNSASAGDLYGKYPFITSTTDNVLISKKQNPVYKVSVDSEKFTGFVNNISNSAISEDVYSCLGVENNVKFTTEDAKRIVETIPTVYAEVNSDNNFTRLYIESDTMNGAITMTADLGFSYPTNVNVTEPVEYVDFSDIIQQITEELYPDTITVETDEEVEAQ